MNKNDKALEEDSYRNLLILEELSGDKKVTQRDLSSKLGIALGLVNSYVKNLAAKGYITVSTIPRQRYKYYLTPKGFIEKSRLAYQHLYNFTNLYNMARRDFRKLFTKLQEKGCEKVVFCGVDEVAEIAYITLQEFGIELIGIVDSAAKEKSFLGFEVIDVANLKDVKRCQYLITSCVNSSSLYANLLAAGIEENKIYIAGEPLEG